MSKRILVVDDHDVVRQGVRLILRSRPEWQVAGEAENGFQAIEKIQALDPDLVILDISMPGKDGLEVLRDLSQRKVRSKILVLTMHDSKELSEEVQKLGASGCVIKTHAGRELVRAMQEIFDGGGFFSSDDAASPNAAAGKPLTEKPEKKNGMLRVGSALLGMA
jgi:DNA-binding NarL/FixJ family response regulator